MTRRTVEELEHLRGTVFAALYYLGWSKPQIAQAFGCNAARVRRLMFAAIDDADRDRLSQLLSDLPQAFAEAQSYYKKE